MTCVGENGFSGASRCRTRCPRRVSAAQAPWQNFRALPLAEHRLHLEAHRQQVGRVDPVALVEGALLATVQHGPTATKVVGVPLTDALARMLGIQLSILRGKVTKAEWALLATR